jgi:hypothetical protein
MNLRKIDRKKETAEHFLHESWRFRGKQTGYYDDIPALVYSAVNHGLMNVVAIKKKQTKESVCACGI